MIIELTYIDSNLIEQKVNFYKKHEVIDFCNDLFNESFISMSEIENDSELFIKYFSFDEWHILNGEKKLFKSGRKVICYIKNSLKGFKVCTGRPSDVSCLSWDYDNYKDALKTAEEYFNNYTIK